MAVIVAGEPGDPQQECFPPALKFKLGPDGQLGGEHEEPIAADARRERDGPDLAKLKIIAALLGIGLDEIRKREAIAQRRRTLMLGTTAAAMAMLAVAAGGLAWLAELRRQEAASNVRKRRNNAASLTSDGRRPSEFRRGRAGC